MLQAYYVYIYMSYCSGIVVPVSLVIYNVCNVDNKLRR